MQEEKLHEGSAQVNEVFEYACNKQGFDKEFCHKQLCAEKYNSWSNRPNLKLRVFEQESSLAG